MRQQIRRFRVQRHREPQERLNSDVPAVLFDQVDLRAVQARFGCQSFLR
jgi:hypothetical protein